jgi:aminopeptidase N
MRSLRSFGGSVTTLAFLLALTLCQPTALLAQRRQQQGSRELTAPRYIPSHDFDTQNIKLDLRFDWEHEQALGTETITLSPLITNLRLVELDAANMTFNSVKLASGPTLKFEANAAQEKLRITLDRAYQPNDTLNIVIDYHTNGATTARGIGGFGRGLTFIKPSPDDLTRPRQIWSQGETEYNHYRFPCYDHPNDFTTTEIIATVEKPLMVISNGKLLSTKDNKDNTRTFDWKIDEPHATYLTSIVVGEYAAVEGNYAGIPVISYVYPSELTEGRATTSRLPAMVKFFSEKTGVKYPYAKYSQTMTRDFGGGMENISATTQTDNMIHDARTELDQTSDSLESHWMSVDPIDGSVNMVFYDRRDTEGALTKLTLARSVDGGRSFVNYKIDVPPFVCNPKVFFGDYSGISAYNGQVVPIFMHFTPDKRLAVSVALFHFKPGSQERVR